MSVPFFGSLSDGAGDCRRGVDDALFEPRPFRHLVVLDDGSDEMKQRVISTAGFGSAFHALPLVEIEGPGSVAAAVDDLPGVAEVLPSYAANEQTRPVVIGLDYLTAIATAQNTGMGTSRYGGRSAGDAVPYPKLVQTRDGWLLEADRERDWPAAPAIVPVVNMSLGTVSPDYPYGFDDIVNLATFGASHDVLVVAAAGNCGEVEGRETMSAWSQPDWVLSVGATEDDAGTILAPYSSRGIAGSPGSGPDLVAYGRSLHEHQPEGTSFAAPRVTTLAIVLATAILQLRSAVVRHSGGGDLGVPLVGSGWIDRFGDDMWFAVDPPLRVPALPIGGCDEEVLSRCVSVCRSHDVSIDIRGSAQLLRHLLEASARPMPGYARHEVGHGFADLDQVLGLLEQFTAGDVVDWFGSGASASPLGDHLSEARVFDRGALERLVPVVWATSPQWRFDWRTGRAGFVPVAPDDLEATNKDERKFGMKLDWPPPIESAR